MRQVSAVRSGVRLCGAIAGITTSALFGAGMGLTQAAPPTNSAAEVVLEEATVDQLQGWMKSGRVTSVALVRMYLDRIEALDRNGPRLNSVIELNPEAQEIAARLDGERKAGTVRGPLHGIPVLIKDNINTGDRMMTTAGSLALAGSPASKDARVAGLLREAGVVILGKTNLSEWANFRSTRSTSGWSGRGGQTKNPYALERSPSGSSSGTGTAIAASLAAIGIGTETDGSIVSPSSVAGLVGLKPTVGLVSRSGIVPISASQDTAGPMTRTVADAAALLGAIAGVDPDDPVTGSAIGHIEHDYTRFLDAGGLRGARIGVARKKFTGYSAPTDQLFEQAIADLHRLGAEIVDPADIGNAGEYDQAELDVLLYEFKDGLNRYLEGRTGVPIRSLREAIEFNEKNKDREMPHFGQERMLQAQEKGPLTEEAYRQALDKSRKLAREGIDGTLSGSNLDAIIAPTGNPTWPIDLINGDHYLGDSSTPAAVSGYPSITVTMGSIHGLPVGLSFIGPAWSEGRLLRLAYAYEQGTRLRRPPKL